MNKETKAVCGNGCADCKACVTFVSDSADDKQESLLVYVGDRVSQFEVDVVNKDDKGSEK